MALGLFKFWSLADLKTLHANATAALLAGTNRTIKAVQSGDVSSEREFDLDSKVFWEELNYALELKGPTTYAPRVTRTRMQVYG